MFNIDSDFSTDEVLKLKCLLDAKNAAINKATITIPATTTIHVVDVDPDLPADIGTGGRVVEAKELKRETLGSIEIELEAAVEVIFRYMVGVVLGDIHSRKIGDCVGDNVLLSVLWRKMMVD